MAYYNQFEFAPAPWLPIQDRQVLDSVGKKAFDAHIGKLLIILILSFLLYRM